MVRPHPARLKIGRAWTGREKVDLPHWGRAERIGTEARRTILSKQFEISFVSAILL